MQLTANVLWTALNLCLAWKGVQTLMWAPNMIYDFLIWALLIAFGILNMVGMLGDRRLGDGWVGKDTKERHARCYIMMVRLLVVEMVAVNLGLLAA